MFLHVTASGRRQTHPDNSMTSQGRVSATGCLSLFTMHTAKQYLTITVVPVRIGTAPLPQGQGWGGVGRRLGFWDQ